MFDTVSGAPDNFKVLKTFLAKIAEIVSTQFWTAGCRVEQLTTALQRASGRVDGAAGRPLASRSRDSDCVELIAARQILAFFKRMVALCFELSGAPDTVSNMVAR